MKVAFEEKLHIIRHRIHTSLRIPQVERRPAMSAFRVPARPAVRAIPEEVSIC